MIDSQYDYFLKPMKFDDFGFKTKYFFNFIDKNTGRQVISNQSSNTIYLKIICKNSKDNTNGDLELKNNVDPEF